MQFFPLRHNQNHGSFGHVDFTYFIYSELFPTGKNQKILGRFHGIGANIIAALLGTVTPFCSCSSIPLFIGFTKCRTAFRCDIFLSDFFPMVDLGFACPAYEYIRVESCNNLCCTWTYHCGCGWYTH